MAIQVDRRRLLTTGALTGATLLAPWSRSAGARQTASPVASPVASPWTIGVPIPEAHSETPAAVIDGQIFIPGGFESGNRVDVFDIASQSWHQIAQLPIRVHHSGVATLNGALYVVGGFLNAGYSAVRMLWSYDWTANIWRSRAPMPQPKGALGLVAANGALYAVGGAFRELGGPASDDLLRYDPAANRWEPLAPMPTKREHLAVVALDSSIHAIGGRANGDEGDDYAAAHEIYDLASGTWSEAEPLPVPRGGLSGVAVDGTVVVLGGERGSKAYADVNRYDPATGAWDALPSLPTARHGLASAYVDGTLYAISGSLKAGIVDNTTVVEILSIASIP